MPRKTTSRKAPAGSGRSQTAAGATDAIEILTEDHRRVDEMFAEYESAKDSEGESEKQQRVEAICNELIIHTSIEEELFYPAARDALGDDGDDMLDEAAVEHASAKELIAQLQDAQPGDELYDAKVKVLGEYIRHHVQEEEGEIFPKLRDSEFNAEALGEEMSTRKEELRADIEEQATS
jgi:hemerythrin superfamily protein